jgi:hypothetical protein
LGKVEFRSIESRRKFFSRSQLAEAWQSEDDFGCMRSARTRVTGLGDIFRPMGHFLLWVVFVKIAEAAHILGSFFHG